MYNCRIGNTVCFIEKDRINGESMTDKIQNAYESSKHIYDDVLTQGSIFSKKLNNFVLYPYI